MTRVRFTSRDLEVLPLEDGKRYEIIDGELYVSRQPHNKHQRVCHNTQVALGQWEIETGLGFVYPAPGVIFAEDDDVVPDIVWASRERLPLITEADGKFHDAPELVVEVLSPGSANQRRDREIKLGLYNRRAVQEYWMIDWESRQVMVCRRVHSELRLITTLEEADTLTSPLLPGFSCSVSALFYGIDR